MEKQLTEYQQKVKQKFIDDRGAWKWSAMWDTILELDPAVVESYATYSSVPDKRGYLEMRMRKFIYIAIDSITGSLNTSGLKGHMKHALQLGVSTREILEVLEITSMIGSTTYELGVPELMDALQQRGISVAAAELNEHQKALKADYIQKHGGYWTNEKENILRLDPEYFESFTAFEETPWKSGVLTPKEKELVYIAVHAAPVSLNKKALRYHIDCALDSGATANEIVEVFELVSTLGIHSITIGVPILKEALTELELC
ncbi:MAG: carboxymuconolactone decarboxylase family protein [Clostridium sp.]|nr:carboxymuconolactone decarboxylase family protein [Clostridium sp.]